jgi:hypothetical protein
MADELTLISVGSPLSKLQTIEDAQPFLELYDVLDIIMQPFFR